MTKAMASLSPGLIVTKGSAKPAADNSFTEKLVSNEKRVALTYKIGSSNYKRLKHLGVEKGMSTQSILDDALNEYLAKVST